MERIVTTLSYYYYDIDFEDNVQINKLCAPKIMFQHHFA